jgi:hypothetical protein
MPRNRTLHKTQWNYLFADYHVAAMEAPKTIDSQYRRALDKTMVAMARDSDGQPPTNPPKYKLPIVSSGNPPAFEESSAADTWWGGLWTGNHNPPIGANAPRE